ncbi:MAG: hypothetical protein QXF12_02890 [Candidatus Aenigmatarchaeota archaeon]
MSDESTFEKTEKQEKQEKVVFKSKNIPDFKKQEPKKHLDEVRLKLMEIEDLIKNNDVRYVTELINLYDIALVKNEGELIDRWEVLLNYFNENKNVFNKENLFRNLEQVKFTKNSYNKYRYLTMIALDTMDPNKRKNVDFRILDRAFSVLKEDQKNKLLSFYR